MTKKVKKEQINWILEKIPKKEEIAVQFCVEEAGKTDIIAIITREIFGEKYQIYEVNSVDKSLILLGCMNFITYYIRNRIMRLSVILYGL